MIGSKQLKTRLKMKLQMKVYLDQISYFKKPQKLKENQIQAIETLVRKFSTSIHQQLQKIHK